MPHTPQKQAPGAFIYRLTGLTQIFTQPAVRLPTYKPEPGMNGPTMYPAVQPEAINTATDLPAVLVLESYITAEAFAPVVGATIWAQTMLLQTFGREALAESTQAVVGNGYPIGNPSALTCYPDRRCSSA